MGAAGARARARRPLAARLWEAFAVVGLGVVITAAALAPALAARGSGTTEVTGRVVAAGVPLPGVAVGFWSPSGGVLAHGRTGADGRFTLTAPTFVDGFVYAGRSPVDEHALFRADRLDLVRGVLGATERRGIAWPLAQAHQPATPRSLGGGRPITLALTQAGRISGGAGLFDGAGGPGTVQVRRLDGGVVQRPALAAGGGFTSGPLVPGVYGLLLTPRAPALPQAVSAVVVGGVTTPVQAAPFQRAATLTGHVTSGGLPLGAAVPLQLLAGDRVVASVQTSPTGAYTIPGLAPGSYRLQAGRYLEPGTPVGPVPPAIPVPAGPAVSPTPSPTPTPTPTPTPSPSPTPSATSTGSGAPTSGRPTADAVLPGTVDLALVAGQTGAVQDLDLQPAGRVTGTVTGAAGVPSDVFLEDPSSHTVLRSTEATAKGDFAFGGLVPGTAYAVYAVDRPGDTTAAVYGGAALTAGEEPQRIEVTLRQPALTLSGRVGGGAAGGTVEATGVQLLGGRATVAGDGTYRLSGLVPAAYSVAASEPGRTSADPVTVVLASSATRDLDRSQQPAVYRAWFLSANAGVPGIAGRAVGADGSTVPIGPGTRSGHVTVRGARPGTYSYDAASFVGAAPAVDGPWFFAPPVGTFTLRPGTTTDVGPVTLRLRARP